MRRLVKPVLGALAATMLLGAVAVPAAFGKEVLVLREGSQPVLPGAWVSLSGPGTEVSFSGAQGMFSCAAPQASLWGYLRYNEEKIDEIELVGAGGALAGEECEPFHGMSFFPLKLALWAAGQKLTLSDIVTLDVGECTYEDPTLRGAYSRGGYNLILRLGGTIKRSPESPKSCGKIGFSVSGLLSYGSRGSIYGVIENRR